MHHDSVSESRFRTNTCIGTYGVLGTLSSNATPPVLNASAFGSTRGSLSLSALGRLPLWLPRKSRVTGSMGVSCRLCANQVPLFPCAYGEWSWDWHTGAMPDVDFSAVERNKDTSANKPTRAAKRNRTSSTADQRTGQRCVVALQRSFQLRSREYGVLGRQDKMTTGDRRAATRSSLKCSEFLARTQAAQARIMKQEKGSLLGGRAVGSRWMDGCRGSRMAASGRGRWEDGMMAQIDDGTPPSLPMRCGPTYFCTPRPS